MHTRNVNVKTAQESSRKMEEEQNLVSVAKEWVAQATALKAGVTVTVSGCVLIWRRAGGDPHQRNA
jgi:uncharacterized protein (DUF4415 family)